MLPRFRFLSTLTATATTESIPPMTAFASSAAERHREMRKLQRGSLESREHVDMDIHRRRIDNSKPYEMSIPESSADRFKRRRESGEISYNFERETTPIKRPGSTKSSGSKHQHSQSSSRSGSSSLLSGVALLCLLGTGLYWKRRQLQLGDFLSYSDSLPSALLAKFFDTESESNTERKSDTKVQVKSSIAVSEQVPKSSPVVSSKETRTDNDQPIDSSAASDGQDKSQILKNFKTVLEMPRSPRAWADAEPVGVSHSNPVGAAAGRRVSPPSSSSTPLWLERPRL